MCRGRLNLPLGRYLLSRVSNVILCGLSYPVNLLCGKSRQTFLRLFSRNFSPADAHHHHSSFMNRKHNHSFICFFSRITKFSIIVWLLSIPQSIIKGVELGKIMIIRYFDVPFSKKKYVDKFCLFHRESYLLENLYIKL